MPASQPRQPRPSKYKRPIFWVQVLLALGIVVGAWLALRGAVQEPLNVAPSHIGDMERVKVLTGESAMHQMQQIHPEDIGIVDGYLADYQRAGEKMTLWVGLASTEADAAKLQERMVSAIARDGTPFSPPAKMTVGGREVFYTSGGGGTNYFFRDAHSVVWVTLVNSAQPATRLADVLKTVKFE